MKSQTLAYTIGNNLYLNITNRCTNSCAFCIRETREGVGYNLWLEREPSVEDLLLAAGDTTPYNEIVFCGYGEPLMRIDTVKEVARILKDRNSLIRINTNGQANLIQGRNVVPELKGFVDTMNISLNAENSKKYVQLCRPVYGAAAYQSLLEFIRQCKSVIPRIILSVVEWPGIDIKQCQAIAEGFEVEFRVRTYTGTPNKECPKIKPA